MTSLDTIKSLDTERSAINARLLPLNRLMAERHGELDRLRALAIGAERELDAAVTRAGLVEGQHLIGAATADDLKTAQEARQRAEQAHGDAQSAVAVMRSLDAEMRGLQDAGAELAERLQSVAVEEKLAREQYLRDIAAHAGSEYRAAAEVLATKFAAVVAANQLLAQADVMPNLLVGSTWNLLVPAFNLDTARSPSGVLVDTEGARRHVPGALLGLKARITNDGVVVPGL